MRFWVVIQPWERAVRVRAGKHTATLCPGFHLRIPYLDEVTSYNNRLRVAAVPSQTLSTLDGKAVTVAGLIGFKIVDPLAVLLNLQSPESSCAAYAQTAIAKYIVGRHSKDIRIEDMQEAVMASIVGFGGGGLAYEFASIVDFAVVRTYRLLQESWRPQT
jgi:regulator of protease activity HflC (stomatin/prohibitin superfamily)